MKRAESEAPPSVKPEDWFVMRTPLLPFDVLLNWVDGLSLPDKWAPAESVERIPRQRADLIKRLKVLVANPVIQEALFLASQSTYEAAMRWLDSVDADPRLEQTLVKYVQRMAARATPFGIFAGCSFGQISKTTDLCLDSADQYYRHTRLDSDYLFAVTSRVERERDVRDALRYRPNSSLHTLAGHWRYVQAVFSQNSWQYCLVALETDRYLDAALDKASAGATIDELVSHLVSADEEGEVSSADAISYVTELIDNQVITSSFSPVVTGPSTIDDLISQSQSIQPLHRVGNLFSNVRDQLTIIDRSHLGVSPRVYERVNETLEPLAIQRDVSKLFQIDLYKPSAHASCGHAILSEVERGIQLLHRLAPNPPSDSLSRFKDSFKARYEGREVPLLEVLDEESGIGFERSTAAAAENAPLLRGFALPQHATTSSLTWSDRDAFLLSKLNEINRHNAAILELSPLDIEQLSNPAPRPLPPAFSVTTTVAASGSPDEEFQLLLRNVVGPSGANLFGRFCQADARLQEAVLRHLQAEESSRPDAVFAEVVHLPEGRLGNIVSRPVLRRFEIPYLGRSGAPESSQLPVSDLSVSVDDGRVVLRSRRLGREVIPRMTTAHNFTRGLGIYRFLCSLQRQDVAPYLGWHWGPLERAQYLPRVTHGRLVLSRARWRGSATMIDGLTSSPFHEQLQALNRWRLECGVPRWTVLADGDNELSVDFSNILSVEAFVRLVSKRSSFVLLEMFPEPDALCARGPEGRFVHELVIPFTRRGPVSRAAVRRGSAVRLPRIFPPGGNWLYAKWYAGTSTVDALLKDHVREFIRSQEEAGHIDRWFFIRYGDPEWHLRLRVHLDRGRQLAATLLAANAAVAPALHNGSVWKVQFDTYEREVERYGGRRGIVISEEVFWHDSECALELLRLFGGDEGMDVRWRLCVVSCDRLMSAMGLTFEQKLRLVGRMRVTTAPELTGRPFTRMLGDRFRLERKSLETLLYGEQPDDTRFAAGLATLNNRTTALEPSMRKLQRYSASGQLCVSLEALTASYLHMHVNRLLRSSHRPQELIIYDFLIRLYESQSARARGKGRI